MMRNDTIAAVSTPPGVGGIAVVRLSGPEALAIALRHLGVDSLQPRRATYCRFGDVDDIVATYYPTGYSGEPTVELSCHGSLYVQQTLVQTLVESGARLAEAGEYTMRAFLNGRLNLSAAEAVADLINAVTPAQHRLAVSQLRGGYAQSLKTLRHQLLDLTSLLELELDFSQEDVEFADRTELRQLLATIRSSLSSLIESFAAGNALKRGIPVAITGAPNAGKSTLLNALLRDDRAIVSSIPGTTRDTIEETLTVDGITLRIIDTAGLRDTTDTIESLGIERSLKSIGEASLLLYLHDITQPWAAPPIDISKKKVITVLTKADLKPATTSTGLEGFITVSAKTGEGMEALKTAIVSAVRHSIPDTGILVSNPRHYDALLNVQSALRRVGQGLDDGTPTDLIAVDLRDALYHLGTITGEVSNDELLRNIFSRFCVGK